MPRLLFMYLFKRIGLSMLVVQLALSVPVVLSYLLYQLPPAAVRGGLVTPALIGISPTVPRMPSVPKNRLLIASPPPVGATPPVRRVSQPRRARAGTAPRAPASGCPVAGRHKAPT